eukprot:CAMPEP_0172326084 /NCGR_PEP_ID=MMETSP1058-20130122/55556_1 /TAXON_ID=83371 /ORGANISM="Detonula confervacea, Strain CCMP 353" /LENGTH=69 /DNA_ID=CAMNT_0013042787 /DNA_START=278 /DNA_END=488 /DNA_ORIENTATION=-
MALLTKRRRVVLGMIQNRHDRLTLICLYMASSFIKWEEVVVKDEGDATEESPIGADDIDNDATGSSAVK